MRAAADTLRSVGLAMADEPGGVTSAADRALDQLHDAQDRASDSPWLGLVGAIPGVDRQIDQVRDLTGTAIELGDLARSAAVRLDHAVEVGGQGPPGRILMLEEALVALDDLDGGLAGVDVPERSGLVPPLAGAVDELGDEIAEARTELAEGRDKIVAVQRLLVGPSRYLILGANNAEMTAGSGMPLSAGVVGIEAGDLGVSPFIASADLFLYERGVIAPGDLASLYALMGIGFDFRGTTATPNFPVVGPLLAEMSARSSYGPVDGVLVVDAITMQELLRITGPVVVGDLVFTADNVVDEILYRNYLRFDTVDDRGQRLDLQSDIARATFAALKTRDIPIAKLVDALDGLAKTRHLLAWSRDSELQALWSELGADGALRPDGLAVSVQNYDGDKLDYHLTPTASLRTIEATTGDRVRYRLSVTLTNTPRDPTSEYIEGTHPERHFVLLDLHLPGAAEDMTTADFPINGIGSDPPMKVINGVYPVFVDETKTVSVDFTLPATMTEMWLLPGARVTPTVFYAEGELIGSDLFLTRVPLPGAGDERDRPEGWPLAVAAFLIVAVGWLSTEQLRRTLPNLGGLSSSRRG